jgi:SAM-dependent methyltransferase
MSDGRLSEFEQYSRGAWSRYIADPNRRKNSIATVASLEVTRVLDVGCSGGHELLPFVVEKGAFGVGVDVEPEVGQSSLFHEYAPGAKVSFVRASAEFLPFQSENFEVVVCRLALPYMDNARALGEIARVLRPNGRLLLRVHYPRYYVRKFCVGLRSFDVLSMIHSLRVLLAGMIYSVVGKQPRGRFPSSETFQILTRLKRELSKYGLLIDSQFADSDRVAPSFVIIKRYNDAGDGSLRGLTRVSLEDGAAE